MAGDDAVDGPGVMPSAEPFSELVAAWVAAKLPGWDAPGGIQDNHIRRGQFANRQRDPRGRANWRAAVERLGRSRRAQGGRKGFEQGVRIDTFVRDGAFLDTILEGGWDDPGCGPTAPQAEPPRRSAMLDHEGFAPSRPPGVTDAAG